MHWNTMFITAVCVIFLNNQPGLSIDLSLKPSSKFNKSLIITDWNSNIYIYGKGKIAQQLKFKTVAPNIYIAFFICFGSKNKERAGKFTSLL